MQLQTKLVEESRNGTVSSLLLDGRHLCYILQDGHRDVKEYGKTRIPAGTYAIRFRKTGGFHANYTKRFGSMHKGMLELQGVPNFQFILIHIGNTPEDTKGCLLTGEQYYRGRDFVSGSEVAYRRVYPIIRDALLAGKEVTIKVDYSKA